MDEFKIVFWIVGLILYFLVKSRKNKSIPETKVPDGETTPTGSKPMTFEELLREITEGKVNQPQVEEPEPVVNYDTQNSSAEESLKPEKQVQKDSYLYCVSVKQTNHYYYYSSFLPRKFHVI